MPKKADLLCKRLRCRRALSPGSKVPLKSKLSPRGWYNCGMGTGRNCRPRCRICRSGFDAPARWRSSPSSIRRRIPMTERSKMAHALSNGYPLRLSLSPRMSPARRLPSLEASKSELTPSSPPSSHLIQPLPSCPMRPHRSCARSWTRSRFRPACLMPSTCNLRVAQLMCSSLAGRLLPGASSFRATTNADRFARYWPRTWKKPSRSFQLLGPKECLAWARQPTDPG